MLQIRMNSVISMPASKTFHLVTLDRVSPLNNLGLGTGLATRRARNTLDNRIIHKSLYLPYSEDSRPVDGGCEMASAASPARGSNDDQVCTKNGSISMRCAYSWPTSKRGHHSKH
jgi:hypothetical protein